MPDNRQSIYIYRILFVHSFFVFVFLPYFKSFVVELKAYKTRFKFMSYPKNLYLHAAVLLAFIIFHGKVLNFIKSFFFIISVLRLNYRMVRNHKGPQSRVVSCVFELCAKHEEFAIFCYFTNEGERVCSFL